VDPFGSNSFTILTYISGENGIVRNSCGYLVKASLGFSPKFGWALAPYILLKKRLDLEAPAATAFGEPSRGFRSRVRRTHPMNLSADSRWLLGLERLVVSIARRTKSTPQSFITLNIFKSICGLSSLRLSPSRQRYRAAPRACPSHFALVSLSLASR
jgi:hypothetical protein